MQAALAVILLLAASAFLSSFLLGVMDSIADHSIVEREAFLAREAESVENWYEANLVSIDGTEEQVLPSVSNRYGAVVLGSKRVACDGEVQAHKYAIVIPGVDGIGTTLDADTGVLTKGKSDQVREVDGCSIEKRRFAESRQRAHHLVLALENYFKGEMLKEQYGTDKNYFIDSGCGGGGKIACTEDSPADVLIATLGVSQSDREDAYGVVMRFDNFSSNVSTSTPPYSARIGFSTPWGTTVWTQATATF
ncbi:MAG: hypothetical protein K8I29_12130 [Alphaproteobacteria bacterium]|uniref:Uncharacterized protein n=1 Tax=Candidatus Nitrobium versatile TaxID=2884831 RepID=A0A953J9C2_9BACT|nr:hypothetical protein [Candidatus Nitrobium versatile]